MQRKVWFPSGLHPQTVVDRSTTPVLPDSRQIIDSHKNHEHHEEVDLILSGLKWCSELVTKIFVVQIMLICSINVREIRDELQNSHWKSLKKLARSIANKLLRTWHLQDGWNIPKSVLLVSTDIRIVPAVSDDRIRCLLHRHTRGKTSSTSVCPC